MKKKPPPETNPSQKALNRTKANRQKQQKKQREGLAELFYSEDFPLSQNPYFSDLNQIRQETHKTIRSMQLKQKVPFVKAQLFYYSQWLFFLAGEGDGDFITERQNYLAKCSVLMSDDEVDAHIQELVERLRIEIYKCLDLVALNPEGHFDLSFLKHDPAMAEDIEALRRLQTENKEPDRTKIALELIFKRPNLLRCETINQELIHLLNSALLWRDRDLVPARDLEERRKLFPHLALPDTKEVLDLMIAFLQDLRKEAHGRPREIPPPRETKRIADALKDHYESVGDPAPLKSAFRDMDTRYGVVPGTIMRSYYSDL